MKVSQAEAVAQYGSITKAAKALGIPRTTLRRQWGLEAPQKLHDPSKPLTYERLRALLSYDPLTGEMAWLVTRGKRIAGAPAGCVGVHGYIVIRIDNKLYRRNRLAWLHTTGEWPADEIDHKNSDRADDCWPNLREATSSQNSCNIPARGVWYERGPGRRKRWGAKIAVSGKQIHLGRFWTEAEAHAAYAEAAIKYHGEFARTE